MNTKKTVVNTFRSKNIAPGFHQQAVAGTDIALLRHPSYEIRGNKTEIVPYMSLYRNTMYYGHNEAFCQYPYDTGTGFEILHSSSNIRLWSCKATG